MSFSGNITSSNNLYFLPASSMASGMALE
jgi:hypothetical protein